MQCFNLCTTYLIIFCIDVDECQNDNGGCEHTCINTPGSYLCECDNGYSLAEDGHMCSGIIYKSFNLELFLILHLKQMLMNVWKKQMTVNRPA